MNSVFAILIFVALPLGSIASGDDDHDDKEICGELELEVEMAVKNQHKDEHVVEGIEEGLATYLGIPKSYVHIKFDESADHSGHGHRRLAAVDHEIADYNITFPPSAADSAVMAASDLLKATKASTQKTSLLIGNITAKVVSSIAEAAASAGETLNVKIVGGELLNNPSIGHTCHAKPAAPTSSSVGPSCFLGFVVLLMSAMF